MSEVQLHLSGAWERDAALERLRSKYAEWINHVGSPLLYQLCKRYEFFTTDEVWAAFAQYPLPAERRVMGALMRGFAKKGLIVKTGCTEQSDMVACHRRDKAIWRSAIYAGVVV